MIEQLEQERGVASKRARRLQDELQRVQQVSGSLSVLHGVDDMVSDLLCGIGARQCIEEDF